jgi:hypothetical protein
MPYVCVIKIEIINILLDYIDYNSKLQSNYATTIIELFQNLTSSSDENA